MVQRLSIVHGSTPCSPSHVAGLLASSKAKAQAGGRTISGEGSLPAADRRMSLEAARLVGRLMHQVDFACQKADKSIFTVFTETDLRAAHVVTRRIASVLATDGKAAAEPAVTLATLKPRDTTDSLIARIVEEPPKPA